MRVTALQATENGASDDELRDLLAFRMMALDDAGACSGRVSRCRARDPASKDCSAQIHLERCADQPGPVDVMGLGERLDRRLLTIGDPDGGLHGRFLAGTALRDVE